jgi:hypothetical protein
MYEFNHLQTICKQTVNNAKYKNISNSLKKGFLLQKMEKYMFINDKNTISDIVSIVKVKHL